MDEAKHPTQYQPPFIVEFMDIQIDTATDHWVLHGVSDSKNSDEDNDLDGYDTTCELDVVSRGTELPSSLPQVGNGEQD